MSTIMNKRLKEGEITVRDEGVHILGCQVLHQTLAGRAASSLIEVHADGGEEDIQNGNASFLVLLGRLLNKTQPLVVRRQRSQATELSAHEDNSYCYQNCW